MSTSRRGIVRTTWVAIRVMTLFTVLLGVTYTFVITGIGQLALPAQSNGSIVTTSDGKAVGSSLIGQSFADVEGDPLPEYFQSRPSAAGDGYDGGASSGSNYGPENTDLIAAIAERKSQIAVFNGVSEREVPPDAVTASSSGLDPHISPEYALIQVERVAATRGIPVETLRDLVQQHTSTRDLGYLGEPRVNVVEINLILDELEA